MQIEVLNHASIKITSDKIYYFDPYKIDKKMSDADYIFITHDHYDHFDYSSIKNVINESTMLIVPACLEEKVKEITNNYTIVYPSCKYEIEKLNFDTVPSYNIGKSFHLKEMNYVGYIVNIKNNKVYVMGDTDVIDEIKDITGEDITLKGKEYKELSISDLEKLGVTNEEDTFIVNYKTGEVINATKKVTESGKALYVYSRELKN